MEQCGWQSIGRDCPPPEVDMVDVKQAVKQFHTKIVLMWPRYEFDSREWSGQEVQPKHCFVNWEYLLERDDIMRVVVWHDAGSDRALQKQWHEDYMPHAYLSWYHEESVMPFASYVQRNQIVRTYHNINPEAVPAFAKRSGTAIVSGAYTHDVYPLRTNCFSWARSGLLGDGVDYMLHPGYSQSGTHSDSYCETLSRYRVAICTASSYRFALRKLFEATACGCRVITDLPEYDAIPYIDGNFVRVRQSITHADLKTIVQREASEWDAEKQKHFADLAITHYNYRSECARVTSELERKYAELQRIKPIVQN